MKKLTYFLIFAAAQLGISHAAKPDSQILMDFTKPETSMKWQVVNDGVMGGLSEGAIEKNDDHIKFYGILSLDNNGGFSSVRAYEKMDLTGKEGVRLRVRGDGRTYQVRFQTNARFRGNRPVSYSGEFKTRAGEWIDVDIPFDSLKQSFHGRSLSGYKFDPAKIERFGFLLADKQEGLFNLDVKRVETY